MQIKTVIPLGVLALVAASVATAEPIHEESVAFGATFVSPMEAQQVAGVHPMSEEEMTATTGELWPLVGAIGAIVAVDLALQSYFWGTYVPSTAGAGKCAVCALPRPAHR